MKLSPHIQFMQGQIIKNESLSKAENLGISQKKSSGEIVISGFSLGNHQ
jgi:hypothetical protein